MNRRLTHYWIAPAAAIATLLLAGCPLETPDSLDEPRAAAFDARLLGEWTHTDPKSHKVTQLSITKTGAAEYQVRAREVGESPDDFRAFVTTIRGEPILNIREIKPDSAKSGYSFARYTLSPAGELSLQFVSEYAVPKAEQKSRATLATFIGAHLADQSLIDSTDAPFVMQRAKTPARRPK